MHNYIYICIYVYTYVYNAAVLIHTPDVDILAQGICDLPTYHTILDCTILDCTILYCTINYNILCYNII